MGDVAMRQIPQTDSPRRPGGGDSDLRVSHKAWLTFTFLIPITADKIGVNIDYRAEVSLT